MPDVLDKLNTLMGYKNYSEGGLYGAEPVFEEEMFDRMFEFIISLDPDQLTEDQASEVMNIIEEIDLEYEDIDEDEEFNDEDENILDEAPRRVRRNKSLRRKRSRAYKKQRSKRKRQVKLYRKSARGRMMAKKAKRMAKRGRTATGRRKRRYV